MAMNIDAIKQAYYEKIGKVKPTSGESLMKIPKAYKKAGGGLKGIGMGALQSIGSIAEMLNTPEGLKIASYVANNPHYLPIADQVERSDANKMQGIGDLVKQSETLDAQKDIAATNRAMELEDMARKEKYDINRTVGSRKYEEEQLLKKQETETKGKTVAEMKQSIDQDKTLSLAEKLAAKAMIDKGESPQFEQKGWGIPLISPKRTVLKQSTSGSVKGGRYSVVPVKG